MGRVMEETQRRWPMDGGGRFALQRGAAGPDGAPFVSPAGAGERNLNVESGGEGGGEQIERKFRA